MADKPMTDTRLSEKCIQTSDVALPIVERLQDAAMTFHGSSINRGCVDCGLSGTLADEAADTIEELVKALEWIAEHKTERPCSSAWEEDARTLVEVQELAMRVLAKIGGEA